MAQSHLLLPLLKSSFLDHYPPSNLRPTPSIIWRSTVLAAHTTVRTPQLVFSHTRKEVKLPKGMNGAALCHHDWHIRLKTMTIHQPIPRGGC